MLASDGLASALWLGGEGCGPERRPDPAGALELEGPPELD